MRCVMASYETNEVLREVHLVRLPSADYDWALIDLVADVIGPAADPRIVEEHIRFQDADWLTDDYVGECLELGHPAGPPTPRVVAPVREWRGTPTGVPRPD